MKPSEQDLRRYQDNFLRKQDGIALYRALAKAEKFLYLGWLSRRFGTQHLLPVVTGLESRDQDVYRGQVEARGIPAEERSHMRALRAMQRRGQDPPESILDLEGWHRTLYAGGLRAAVFGANDGLLSNFSLMMGIAGASAEPRFVLLAGIAGLLAGASSMAAGEYVSVRSQRELYEQQIAVERQELEMSPEEEKEELALIYQAKGVPSGQAEELADRIFSNPDSAIETLAREELGLDPAALGSPWLAAASSFVAFATGAIIPVIPYVPLSGNAAINASSSFSSSGDIANSWRSTAICCS